MNPDTVGPSDRTWQDRPHPYQSDRKDGVFYEQGPSCLCGRPPDARLHDAVGTDHKHVWQSGKCVAAGCPDSVGPQFLVDGSETRADGTVIYVVHGYAVPSPADEALNEEMGIAPPEPHRRYLGRVWEQKPYGWVAAPPRLDERGDTWSDEVNRAWRHFADQRDACMYLYGHVNGVGAVRYAETLATMPWMRGPKPA